MTDSLFSDAVNASTPQVEMDALTAKVTELTALCLDMTKLCIDVQAAAPGIALSKKALQMTSLCLDIKAHIPPAFIAAANEAIRSLAGAAAAPAEDHSSDALLVAAAAITPDALEAKFPPGLWDDITWQVVCVGREPGLYANVDEANAQLTGVPNQAREKKKTRIEALAYYRRRYDGGHVKKWVPAEED